MDTLRSYIYNDIINIIREFFSMNEWYYLNKEWYYLNKEWYYLNKEWYSIINPKLIGIELGHFDLLKWGHNDGRLGSYPCVFAAKCGNIEALKWLREYKYPWDKSVCNMAAGTGNLNMLIWARENGWERNNRVYNHAVCNGSLDIVKWIIKMETPVTNLLIQIVLVIQKQKDIGKLGNG